MRASPTLRSRFRNICPNGNLALICNAYGESADGRGDDRVPERVHAETQRTRTCRRRVLRLVGQGRHRRCFALTDRPEDARAALNEAWAGLQATRLDAQVLGSKFAEDTGTVAYRYTWHLPKHRTWTLRRPAQHGAQRGQLGGPLDRPPGCIRNSVSTRRLRCVPTRRGAHRSTSAAASDVLVPGNLYHFALDARLGRRLPDDHRDRGRRCAAAVRRHPGCAAPRGGGEFVAGAAEPDHPAPVRPRPGGRRAR